MEIVASFKNNDEKLPQALKTHVNKKHEARVPDSKSSKSINAHFKFMVALKKMLLGHEILSSLPWLCKSTAFSSATVTGISLFTFPSYPKPASFSYSDDCLWAQSCFNCHSLHQGKIDGTHQPQPKWPLDVTRVLGQPC